MLRPLLPLLLIFVLAPPLAGCAGGEPDADSREPRVGETRALEDAAAMLAERRQPRKSPAVQSDEPAASPDLDGR